METHSTTLESLVERAESYAKTTFELSKLKLIDASAGIVSSVVSRVSAVIIFCIFITVFSIGLSMMVGEQLGKMYYGFFAVSALYLIIGLVTYFFLHSSIKKPVSNIIIKKTFKNN